MSGQLVDGGRIGFLADTHCHKPDGSDLPTAVLDALRGVDLIIHLGDMGERWVLDRLEAIAPVLATRGGDDPQNDPRQLPTRVIEAGGLMVGALFDLQAAGIAAIAGERLTFPPQTLDAALHAAFGRRPDVVAFAATHRDVVAHHHGMLFVNPGSATLPAHPSPNGLGTVALLDIRAAVATVEIVRV
jgi:uncharacterized protein